MKKLLFALFATMFTASAALAVKPSSAKNSGAKASAETSAPLPKAIKAGHERTKVRRQINLPAIDGKQLLKCDFHIHSVFSDGIVWPSLRVDEAWEEGLDVIAMTEHLEGQPARPGMEKGDHNRSYQLCKANAAAKNIILVPGAEITRSMPPGHLNALFITDANALNVADPMEAIGNAKKQGAFIEWNHPGWGVDSIMWHPMHEEIYKRGWMDGIEVFNEFEWYPVALNWANDKKLTLIANTDVHDVTDRLYDFNANPHRPMTLVLAADRSLEGVKQGLLNRQTIMWFFDTMIGSEELLSKLFAASVAVASPHHTDGNTAYRTLTNTSDMPFRLKLAATPGEATASTTSTASPSTAGYPTSITIPAMSSIVVATPAKGSGKIPYTVENLILTPTTNLTVTLF